MKFGKRLAVTVSFIFTILFLTSCGDSEKSIKYKTSNNDEEKKIEKLITQRDEAIKIALDISKNSKDINSKKLNSIKNIENARDEAIYVSLGIQQENRELKSKINKINRNYNQDIQYFEKTITQLKKVEDRDHLKKELKRYRLETRKLKSDIRKVQRSLKLEIKDIKRETKLKTRTIGNLTSEIKKHKKTNNVLEKKLTKAKDETDKAIKLAISINNELNTKVIQSQQKSDEAMRIALNINIEKEKLDAKNRELNIKIAQLINNSYTKLNIPKVAFKSDSAILTEQSSQLLDKIVSIIKEYPEYNYEIQGHTDSHGNELYNLKLSTLRAKSVNDYLLSKGIDDGSLSFKGFGSSTPIADNDTKYGRDINRRVLIKVK